MSLTKTFARIRGDEFDSVSNLLADTKTYPAGTILTVLDGGHRYECVSSNGTLGKTNAGGQEFNVILGQDGYYNARAFGLTSGGDFYNAMNPAISAGLIKKLLIDVDCTVDTVIETADQLDVRVSAGTTITIQTNDGIFNVNASPFSFVGEKNAKINHSSRVLFFGNDPLLTFDGIEVGGFRMARTSTVNRTTFYFPNSAYKNVFIRDIVAEEFSTPSNSKLIDLAWGSTSGSENWTLDNITTTDYGWIFYSSGTAYAESLIARNIRGYSCTDQGFNNYHFRRAELDIYLNANAEPAYIWGGTSSYFNLTAINSVKSGYRIEQLQSRADVHTRDCGDAAVVVEWGSNNSTLNVDNEGGTYAVEINPGSNLAAVSTIEGIKINIVTRGHANGGLFIDQNLNNNHIIRDIFVSLIALDSGASGALGGIVGRNLETGFNLVVSDSYIDSTHQYAIDVRSRLPATDALRGYVSGSTLVSSTSSLIRTDKGSGRFLVQACVLDDFSKLSSWKLDTDNFVSNCWDNTTNANVSS